MRQLALDLAVEIAESSGGKAAPASTGPRLRDCRPEEVEAVLALWKEAETTINATDTAATLRLATTDSTAFLVAEQDGRLVGSVIGTFDGWRGNAYRLAVHPAYRRRGIARSLIAEVERRLAAVGAKRMTALVLQDQPSAMGFWQSVGYQRDPRMARFVRNLADE